MKKIIFIIILTALLVNCDEEDNPVSPGIQTIFSLHFDAGMNNGIMNVDVDFMTNNLSEIPTVTINDQNIIEFVFDQGSILGELRNIDYSDTYNYSISAGGKTTSGIITMPAMPDSIRCNGSILIEGDNNNISAASSFHFTWECTNYDYFVCEYRNDENREEITSDTEITFSSDESNNIEFRIKSMTGPMVSSGNKPNVSGDYGDGYITAESVRSEYPITID